MRGADARISTGIRTARDFDRRVEGIHRSVVVRAIPHDAASSLCYFRLESPAQRTVLQLFSLRPSIEFVSDSHGDSISGPENRRSRDGQPAYLGT
jgi:hypothetical protein